MTNDSNNERKKQVPDLVILLHQKGYRRQFALVRDEHSRHMYQGSLKSCLEKFFEHYDRSCETETMLRLDTYARYVSPQDSIHCTFTLAYDRVKGFAIRHMVINDGRSNDRRQYRYISNHQVPGAAAVAGLFPKPKPWDHLLKRRFRP